MTPKQKQKAWSKLSETDKENVVNDLLDDAFGYAVANKNTTPAVYFEQNFNALFAYGLSDLLAANAWINGRIKQKEEYYGFLFYGSFSPANEPDTTPHPPEPPAPEPSWFAKNKYIVIFTVVAIIIIGAVIYFKYYRKK
jgi:hypothetical protein